MKKLSKTDAAFIELQSGIALVEWAKKFRNWTWETAIEKYLEFCKDKTWMCNEEEYQFWTERLKDEKERLPFTTPMEDLISYWKKRSLFKNDDWLYVQKKVRQIWTMGMFLNRVDYDTDNSRKETARK